MAYRELTKYGDALSPSWVASKGIEIFCSWFGLEFNPIDEAKKVLAGNWEEYAECAEAWTVLGKFCDELARNIGAGNRALEDSWSGNAADGTHVYFEKLSKDIADMKESFDSLKEHYEALTEAVWHATEASGDILSGMLDLALIIGLTAAAGASTSWTLVGPAIAGGAIAGELAMMATLYAKFTAVISTVQTVVSGSTGAVVQVNRLVEAKMVKFPLPRSGYDNPAV